MDVILMLSQEDIYKSRDVSTAEMVAMLAELKYFDEQFIYYGCAYAQDGVVKYRINEKAEKLYRFWQNSEANGIYPTNITKYVQLLKVPSGKEQEKRLLVQQAVVEKLKEDYPLILFQALSDLGATVAEDRAAEILRTWQDELDLCYEEDRIELFAGCVRLAFEAKLLTKTTFQAFEKWLEARKEIIGNCENVIWRDKRYFYGFVYWQDGRAQIYSNADETIVQKHRYDVLCQKMYSTPIFTKYYWFDSQPQYTISQWRALFEKQLLALVQEEGSKYLQQIWQLPAIVQKAQLDKWLEQMAGQQYTDALQVLSYYQMRWQMVR